jgi:hypothetical protein
VDALFIVFAIVGISTAVFTFIHRVESDGFWWEPAERAKREYKRRTGRRIASLIREGMTPSEASYFAEREASAESERTRKAHEEAK